MTENRSAKPQVGEPTIDDVVEEPFDAEAEVPVDVKPKPGKKTESRKKAEPETDPGKIDPNFDPDAMLNSRDRFRAVILDQDGEEGMPDWVKLPDGNFKMPKKGKRVFIARFRAEWTDAPEEGDRQCIMWGLTEQDERLAAQASAGLPSLTNVELAKRMIRAVDGVAANWGIQAGTTRAGNARLFWREIGPMCRQLITMLYISTHVMSPEDRRDFFQECFVSRTVS